MVSRSLLSTSAFEITNLRSATTPLMKWQKTIFGVIDEFDYKIVLDYYGFTEQMLAECLLLLREWYTKEPHLAKINLEDRILGGMLSLSKFSVEATKKRIEDRYTAATIMPEFFGNRDPWSPEISKALDLVDWAFLPELSSENYRIQILRFNEYENAYDPVTYLATVFMIADMRLVLDICLGDILIWDLANVTIGHVIKMTPLLVKKTMFVAQRCYGARVKRIHVLNLPPYAEVIVQGIKAVLKKKVADRFFVHKTLEDFHKALPKHLIPKDLGGDYPETCRQLADNLRATIKSPEWRSWYVETTKDKTDESKRINKSETIEDDLLGLKGTFRKLEID